MATRNSIMLAATDNYIKELQKFADELQLEFDDYQKQCTVNAIRTINPMIESNGYSWQNFSIDNIYTVLQQVAFLGLNASATPRECYFIVRKNYDKDRNLLPPTLEFGIEGAGNDIILRKFGQDVVDLKSYIVYKGDDFKEGYMDGWEMTLPTYRRTFKTNTPEKVVYLIKKTNGEIDVQYSDTEDVKKSLLANARQNGADEKLLRQLNKLGLYELLNDEKWLDYKIKKTYGSKTYETPLFNPSYTSVISMYNMIERKLRNHATRKYPKNFNVKGLSELYENTFEEKYDKHGELISPEEKVAIANDEIKQETIIEPDFKTVESDGREVIDPDNVETETETEQEEIIESAEQEEEQSEESTVTDEEAEIFFNSKEEPESQQESKDKEKIDDDDPEW